MSTLYDIKTPMTRRDSPYVGELGIYRSSMWRAGVGPGQAIAEQFGTGSTGAPDSAGWESTFLPSDVRKSTASPACPLAPVPTDQLTLQIATEYAVQMKP